MKFSKYLYVIGGCALGSEKRPIDSIERISVEQSGKEVSVKSEICGQLLHPKRSPSVFIGDEDSIIIVGGCLSPNNHSDEIEVLKYQNDFSIPQLLESKCEVGHSCAAFSPKSKIKVIFGGFEAHNCLDSVQVQGEDGNFKKVRGFLPKLKNSVVLDVGNDEFLLFGGWQDEKETTAAIRRLKFNKTYTEYSVDFEGFLPYPVEGHTIVQKDDFVYLIGGFDGCFVITSIIRYNLRTKKSEVLEAKLSEKRENHVSGLIGENNLVVAGGWNSKHALDSIEVFKIDNNGNLEKYNISSNSPKLITPRNRPSSVSL